MEFEGSFSSSATICSVSRYTGSHGVRGRVIIGTGISYTATGTVGAALLFGNVDDWLVMCSSPNYVFADGVDVRTGNQGRVTSNLRLGINYGPGSCCNGEVSSWAVAEMMVWNRALSKTEMRDASAYLMEEVLGRIQPRYPPPPSPPPPSPPPVEVGKEWLPYANEYYRVITRSHRYETRSRSLVGKQERKISRLAR
eukprot:CAMPEP_0179701108 /NCGR_PEP_ID=MMETSP0937-20121108/1597_1 /TAXON_ID=548131 ORGANISM="Ostreococcus mediterraneus, Strain clade-D-RCC2593" /NCGR_SAMPLE_ID=MMETSP0937 /ASSEMBLY_ACC=CAM_ASM_000575 /LENGTH=196 /DNA_ID=CAMNT_0021574211 /DNA_START=56 /DNA_END=647 /DNA_ORIENTATION=+